MISNLFRKEDELVEPSTWVWTFYKFVFIFINSALLLLIFYVSIRSVTNAGDFYKENPILNETTDQPPKEEPFPILAFVFTLILATLLSVIGLYGIIKRSLACLYAYIIIIVADVVISAFFASDTYTHLTLIVTGIFHLTIIIVIVREIFLANGKVSEVKREITIKNKVEKD